MIYSCFAGDSTEFWDIGYDTSDPDVDPVVLADMADGFSCWISVPGSAISRAVPLITDDGKYFRAFLTPAETVLLSGMVTVAIELRNPALVPALVRETHLRLRVRPGLIAPV